MSTNSLPSFPPLTTLGELSIETFLAQYWQKKPVLIRGAIPGFTSLISGDELAGLALEDEVVSRLVVDQGQEWTVEHGPLPESRFASLPDSNWTLLVQHVDSLDPQVNALLQAFRFIPNWRLDDIMISYAPDGGGVGPHFDYFDVFLLQAEGTRRWRLGQQCDKDSALVPDQPMKILQHFDTREEFVTEPGDLLYIPARHAHWGQAIGESITYSIGFRAPSHADFILDLSQEIASHLGEDQRYQDEALVVQQHPGEIAATAIATFATTLEKLYGDKTALALWLGEYSTQLKHDVRECIDALSADEIRASGNCQLSAFCRCAFTTVDKQTWVFVAGHSWPSSHALAVNLSEYQPITLAQLEPADQKTLFEIAALEVLVATAS